MEVTKPTSPIEALSTGLLNGFTDVRNLEQQLEQIIANQSSLLECVATLNDFYTQNEDYMEVQLMVSSL